ncbi:unnamed protein product [Citrullus colocynthis]|uniref:Uncharacterized protein n=1 Tax=Citrullus colocynthis TaxID=252529 RepID=A0ABP0YTI2_9ROSI
MVSFYYSRSLAFNLKKVGEGWPNSAVRRLLVENLRLVSLCVKSAAPNPLRHQIRCRSHASFCLPRSVRSALSLEICHRRPDLLVKELHRLQQRTYLLQSARLQPRSGPFVPICSDQPRSKFNIRHFRSCRPAVPDSSHPLRSDPLAACRSRAAILIDVRSCKPNYLLCDQRLKRFKHLKYLQKSKADTISKYCVCILFLEMEILFDVRWTGLIVDT